MADVFPEYGMAAKSVDEDDPPTIHKLPRGYSGITILWTMSISRITIQPDSTSRIITVTHLNLAITNVYLPCRGGVYFNQDYKDEVNHLSDIQM